MKKPKPSVIYLRLSQSVKTRIADRAHKDRTSVNKWILEAVNARLSKGEK